MMTETAREESEVFNFDNNKCALDLVRNIYFYNDLPSQVRDGDVMNCDALMMIVGDLVQRLMSSNCKFYSVSLF